MCIRGAGIVGRTLALLLARDRLRVALVDAAAAAGRPADVRAYALNAASRAILEALRAWPEPVHATPVTAMEVHGDAGGALTFRATEEGVPALNWIVEVEPLLARLGEAVRFQPRIELVQAPVAAKLTVVCEGRHSSTREAFGVQFDVAPYPQRAIAARLQLERGHGQVARQWFIDGEVIGLLPLGGPDGQTVALVWSVREERADELLALAPDAFAQRLRMACGDALGAIQMVSERAAWPLQRATADRWCGPGWVLAGDAAHIVHPLAGQGLNLGLGDALALADVLQHREYWRELGDVRLLRRYERRRKGDVLTMGLTSEALQQLFARPAETWVRARNWGLSGFDRSGPIKHWAARVAMGAAHAA